jgi:hypothetical protein
VNATPSKRGLTSVAGRIQQSYTFYAGSQELDAATLFAGSTGFDRGYLLDGVVEQLLADPRSWRPLSDEHDWRHWMVEAAELLHRFLTDQPVALHVYLRHPVTFPAALTRMDTMLGVLIGGGLDDQQARRAYAAVHTYTVGFAALEASRANWTAPSGADATVEALAGFTSDAQFHAGLDFLLDGIEAGASPGMPG